MFNIVYSSNAYVHGTKRDDLIISTPSNNENIVVGPVSTGNALVCNASNVGTKGRFSASNMIMGRLNIIRGTNVARPPVDMTVGETPTNVDLTSIRTNILPSSNDLYSLGTVRGNTFKSVAGVNVAACNMVVNGDVECAGSVPLNLTTVPAKQVSPGTWKNEGGYVFPGRVVAQSQLTACNMNDPNALGYTTISNQYMVLADNNTKIGVFTTANNMPMEDALIVDRAVGINSVNTPPTINFICAGGTPENPLPTPTGAVMMALDGIGHDGVNWTDTTASIRAIATGDYSLDQGGASLHFMNRNDSNELVTRMIIDENGNVGIGTSNPQCTLDVNGSINYTSNLRINGLAYSNHGYFMHSPLNSNAIFWYTDDRIDPSFWGNVGINDYVAQWTLDVNGSINFSGQISKNGVPIANESDGWLRDNATNIVHTMSNVSNVNSNYPYPLAIIGDSTGTTIYTNGTLYEASDARLKTDLQLINNALDKVCSVHGYTYTAADSQSGKRMTGVLAQEIKEVLPEVVTYDAVSDRYSVAYHNIVPLLVEALRELKDKHDALYARKMAARA